jgi:hypothetical protein
VVNDLEYACMDLSILELWANDGIYDSKSDQDIASLTLEGVLGQAHNMLSRIFQIQIYDFFIQILCEICFDLIKGSKLRKKCHFWQKEFVFFFNTEKLVKTFVNLYPEN